MVAVTSESEYTCPAIVLGDSFTALGVTRILAQNKIKTYNLVDTGSAIRLSRWGNPLAFGVDPFISSDGLASLLESLEIKEAVLFPTSDKLLSAVIGLPSNVRSRFSTCTSTPESLDTVVDKRKFAVTIAELEIPHPETIIIDRSDQLRAHGD